MPGTTFGALLKQVHTVQTIPVWIGKGTGSATTVAGVYFHRAAFDALVKKYGVEHPSHDGGVYGQTDRTAVLVPEPHNPKDANAVKVLLDGVHVGYIAAAFAPSYTAILNPLAGRNWFVEVGAHLYWTRGAQYGDPERSVNLQLPPAHLILPANAPPTDPWLMLPNSTRAKVAGGGDRQAPIVHLLGQYGEALMYGVLNEKPPGPSRSTKPVVELTIDGNVMGQFSAKLSEDTIAVVRRAATLGVQVTVETYVRGNALDVEVWAYPTATSALDQDWLSALDRLGASTTTSVATRGSSITDSASGTNDQIDGAKEPLPPLLPDAAWFPDPYDSTQWRYWDGSAWTRNTAPRN
jgi:hypothetical protein